MERNEHKEIDVFIKKMVKEAGLESPSQDFTNKVFHQIQGISVQSPVTLYQPLISKKTWGILGILFLGIIGYLQYGSTVKNTLWLSGINTDFLSKFDILAVLSNISLSETMSYSLVGLAFCLYIQLFFIKRYLDRRIHLV
jgi:hypothetical protein